jgi:nicotinamidase-related amidase
VGYNHHDAPEARGGISDETTRIYARAGFGAEVERGRRPALVVVDLSRGFTEPAFPTGSDLSSEVAATRRLLDVARDRGLPLFFTTIAYEPGDETRLAWLRKAPGLAVLATGSELVEIDPRLEPGEAEPILVKQGASAFFGTDLAERLRGVGADTVVICGATTSGCVRASVVDAVQHGFPTLVVREAVGDRAQEPHDANLFDIEAKYGDVISLEDAVGYLSATTAPTYQEGTR